MAIAFDLSSDGGLVFPGTSLSWTHTCSGSNLILYVGVFGDTVSGDPTGANITGVTYNSVSMTQVAKVGINTDRWCYLYRLIAPATGANSVAISASASIAIAGVAASYTGVAQSGQPDVDTTNDTNSSGALVTISTSVTTTVDGDWVVAVSKNSQSTTTGSGSNTIRQTNGDGLSLGDTNGAISPAGSVTMGFSTTGTAATWGVVMEAFKPAVIGGDTQEWLGSYPPAQRRSWPNLTYRRHL